MLQLTFIYLLRRFTLTFKLSSDLSNPTDSIFMSLHLKNHTSSHHYTKQLSFLTVSSSLFFEALEANRHFMWADLFLFPITVTYNFHSQLSNNNVYQY